MANIISGPGLGLPYPQNLYPSQLSNAPQDVNTNYITLSGGDTFVIPAGRYAVNLGRYSVLQWLDPVTGVWRIVNNGTRGRCLQFQSDGFSFRIANLTGCPIAAQVVNGGSNYVQATTSVVASGGSTTSTWQPIVGGALSVVSVATAGKNYTVPPVVLISAPPSPGIPATAYATLASGSVSAVTLSNVGAGYTSVPNIQIVPSPQDVNFATITTAVVSVATVNNTAITGVLCTNHGAAQSTIATVTLTPSGAGSSASISAVNMSTIVSTTIAAAGVGFGTTAAKLTTVGGGVPATSTYVNPEIELNNFISRDANYPLTLTATSITAIGTATDSGLFVGTPTAIIQTSGSVPTTAASISMLLGAAVDTVALQPY